MKTINYFIISAIFAFCAACSNTTAEAEHEHEHEHSGETDRIEVSEEQMKTVKIELGRIEQREISGALKVSGVLKLNPQSTAAVSSLLGGIVKKIMVVEGQKVSAGQTVALIENTEIVTMQKNYLTASHQMRVAKQEADRQRTLAASGAGVEKSLQKAQADYEVAQAELTGLAHQLRQLNLSPSSVEAGNIATTMPVKAPISGIVNRVFASTGSYSDMQTPLLTISNNDDVYLDLSVFEKDLQYVKIGEQLDFALTNQVGSRLKGEVYAINRSLDTDTKTVSVHAKILGSKSNLIPEMFVTAVINTGARLSDALPDGAIVSANGKSYIYVLEGVEDETDEHGHSEKMYHFVKTEVIAGTESMGFTAINTLTPIDSTAQIITANAFYVNSMASDHGEHNH